LTKGVGYFFIDVDKDADRGMGEVVFKQIDPYDVYVDPMSRDFLFRDAAYISIRKNLSRTQLEVLFPDHKAKIKKATGTHAPANFSQSNFRDSDAIRNENIVTAFKKDGEDDEILSFFETYSKIKVPLYNLTVKVPPTKQELAQIQETVKVAMTEYTSELEVENKEKKKAYRLKNREHSQQWQKKYYQKNKYLIKIRRYYKDEART